MRANESTAAVNDILAQARLAGLERAASEFPEDVVAAAAAAADAQRACVGIAGAATAEPWPPMRARAAS